LTILAHNEDLTVEDLTRIKERYTRLAEAARAKTDLHPLSDATSDTPAE
jgi:hypothetical protein